jgi:predicted RNase H-like HicB family nuclease
MKRKHDYHVIIERDEDGFYVAEVLGLPGCHTQARTMDKLLHRVREAIELCQEDEEEMRHVEFVGIQRVAV